jgi:hypothetical protein
MVDWEWVDRQRSAGASWEEIANDRRSGFEPEAGPLSPGRQLRRRSRERAEEGPAPGPDPAAPARRWPLVRVAWLLFSVLGPWALLAYLLPSPIGVYLPTIPLLGIAAAIAALLLAIALLRSARKWGPELRQTATIGSVIGLVLAGVVGGAALAAGCPVLSPFLTSEPGGWQRVPHANWSSGASPVLFFYGSVACPYCSASSWAVLGALERLGNVSGVSYDHSTPNDVYPNTPSVVLANLSLVSPYLALDIHEATNDQQIQAPSIGACTEQAYLSAYDPLGGIPFVAVGGVFVHAGSTLVDPGAFNGLSTAQVLGELGAHQGSAYTAVVAAEDLILAFVVVLDHGGPPGVVNDPAVAAIVGEVR